MLLLCFLITALINPLNLQSCNRVKPIVINTWPFPKATDASWAVLNTDSYKPGSAIDAVVAGCTAAEQDLNIESVGYGNSPDENGNSALDAMVMDGRTMKVGAVAAMSNISDASKVAREVLLSTDVTLLVGSGATAFAKSRGFNESNLNTNNSIDLWHQWVGKHCQPNFRISQAWIPDPSNNCGPYKAQWDTKQAHLKNRLKLDEQNHDTIGMIALDAYADMAVGTSTSGSSFKIPGRVGDSAIAGAGAYVDNQIGGAAATGDGDLMMRYLLSFQVVQFMHTGLKPTEACKRALDSVKYTQTWYGAVVALTKNGEHGAACVGFADFNYCVRSADSTNGTEIIHVKCRQ